MKLTLQTISGKVAHIDVDETVTVSILKKRAENLFNFLHNSSSLLIYNGQILLNDDAVLTSIDGLTDNSVIVVIRSFTDEKILSKLNNINSNNIDHVKIKNSTSNRYEKFQTGNLNKQNTYVSSRAAISQSDDVWCEESNEKNTDLKQSFKQVTSNTMDSGFSDQLYENFDISSVNSNRVHSLSSNDDLEKSSSDSNISLNTDNLPSAPVSSSVDEQDDSDCANVNRTTHAIDSDCQDTHTSSDTSTGSFMNTIEFSEQLSAIAENDPLLITPIVNEMLNINTSLLELLLPSPELAYTFIHSAYIYNGIKTMCREHINDSSHDQLYSLTSDDFTSLKRMCRMGFPANTVLSVYLNSNKQEDIAVQILLNGTSGA